MKQPNEEDKKKPVKSPFVSQGQGNELLSKIREVTEKLKQINGAFDSGDMVSSMLEAFTKKDEPEGKVIDSFPMKPEWSEMHLSLESEAKKLANDMALIKTKRDLLWAMIDMEAATLGKTRGSSKHLNADKQVIEIIE